MNRGVAVPYELGCSAEQYYGTFGALYPIYVRRGEACLAARQGAEAASEFQKILDHRGIVVSDPIGALAHLQPGRAFAFSVWKGAGPDIPILTQAKAEYARLQ